MYIPGDERVVGSNHARYCMDVGSEILAGTRSRGHEFISGLSALEIYRNENRGCLKSGERKFRL